MNDVQNSLGTKKFSRKKLLALLSVTLVAVVGIGYLTVNALSATKNPPVLEADLTSLAQGKLSTSRGFATLPSSYEATCTGADLSLNSGINYLFSTEDISMESIADSLKFSGDNGQYLIAFYSNGSTNGEKSDFSNTNWYIYPTKDSVYKGVVDVQRDQDTSKYIIPAYRGFALIVNTNETKVCGSTIKLSNDTANVWEGIKKDDFVGLSFPEGWVMIPMYDNATYAAFDAILDIKVVFSQTTTGSFERNIDFNDGFVISWINLGDGKTFDDADWTKFREGMTSAGSEEFIIEASDITSTSAKFTFDGYDLKTGEKYAVECKTTDVADDGTEVALVADATTGVVSGLIPNTAYTCIGYIKGADGSVIHTSESVSVTTLANVSIKSAVCDAKTYRCTITFSHELNWNNYADDEFNVYLENEKKVNYALACDDNDQPAQCLYKNDSFSFGLNSEWVPSGYYDLRIVNYAEIFVKDSSSLKLPRDLSFSDVTVINNAEPVTVKSVDCQNADDSTVTVEKTLLQNEFIKTDASVETTTSVHKREPTTSDATTLDVSENILADTVTRTQEGTYPSTCNITFSDKIEWASNDMFATVSGVGVDRSQSSLVYVEGSGTDKLIFGSSVLFDLEKSYSVCVTGVSDDKVCGATLAITNFTPYFGDYELTPLTIDKEVGSSIVPDASTTLNSVGIVNPTIENYGSRLIK